jgi:hypothetical protein
MDVAHIDLVALFACWCLPVGVCLLVFACWCLPVGRCRTRKSVGRARSMGIILINRTKGNVLSDQVCISDWDRLGARVRVRVRVHYSADATR